MRATFYLLLAIAGLVVTAWFNARFMQEQGFTFDIVEFLRQGYANNASASLTSDIVVAFLAFCVFVLAECRRLGMRHGWLYVVLGTVVAMAFAFPLFLYMRERHLQAAAVTE